jgi:hypothetical protein
MLKNAKSVTDVKCACGEIIQEEDLETVDKKAFLDLKKREWSQPMITAPKVYLFKGTCEVCGLEKETCIKCACGDFTCQKCLIEYFYS